MTSSNNKIIVGSEEWCSFPALGIPAIKARVDSGAKTSSIHAFNIQTFRRDGILWASFEVHPLQKDRRTVLRCERPVVDKRSVKSSSGISETRYVISTLIKVEGETWEVELTLANRDSMGYRMLLGREAMKGRILVDPELSLCLNEPSKEQLYEWYGQPQKNKSGLKIGLLASNPDLYSNMRLMEAAEERGHEMVFLNIKYCYMKVDEQAPEVHYRGGRILNNLDAVVTRIRPSMTFYGCALARQFESMGIYTVNSSSAITQSRDKLFSLQLMLKSGIGIPTTGFAHSPMDTSDLIEMVGGAPLIVKLLEGTQGRGVVLAETKKAAESVINAFKALHANLLVQEFRANIHQGGSASVVKITREERRLAMLSAKVLGLKVAGVDIIRSSKGPLLLEVNSSPGLEGIESATGKDIAGLIIASIEKRLKWERPVSSSVSETL